ncbi:MAG TPA: hypothetical protein VHM90_10820, partial [Phycisphaerae bacterium]|nr:hypothetical protein [Phycisphaerae bacterium]
MNHTANTPRPLAAVCLAAATMLLAMPLWGQQGPLWQTPKGIDAQDETPPGPFDRDAGERRRIGVPLPTMAQPVMQLWYRPRQPLHEARQGQVLAPAAGTPLAEYPATKISLAIAAKPAQLAVEDFGKAAGLTIRGRDAYFLRDSSLPAMNLQFSDAPMLEGLLQMCSQLGTLPTEVIPKRITIAPVEADTGVGKWCVS